MIVLLDQVEDLIDTSTDDFAITDRPLDEALRALLTVPARGLKVIVTTRVAPDALLAQSARQRILNLDEGLDSPHAEEMLLAGIQMGSSACRPPPPNCSARPGSIPTAIRGHWKPSRRSWPPTKAPPCLSCWTRQPACQRTW